LKVGRESERDEKEVKGAMKVRRLKTKKGVRLTVIKEPAMMEMRNNTNN